MNSSEIRKNCKKYLPGQYSQSPQQYFQEMAKYVDAGVATDIYGQGKFLNDFEVEVAQTLGKEAAVFMPSGVMAQQIALRIWSDQTGIKNIAYHPTSHLEREEFKAHQVLHGLNGITVGNQHQLITPVDLETIAEPIAALLLELPQRRIGGLLPEWKDLLAIREWVDEQSAFMHLDGARLWESQPYYSKPYSEICDLFDSVYISFYKGLGGMSGAMLVGDESFIEEAKIWQRRHGGNLYQQFPFVVYAKYVFEHRLPKMKAYYEKAKDLARVLDEFEGITLKPNQPQINMFHIFLNGDLDQLLAARNRVAKEKGLWLINALVPTQLPGCYNSEIAIGDAGLDLTTDELREAFELFFQYLHTP
ncbi:MAG: low specificity L-threonine aldolase [Vicingus serpentipes]|nr:low specificity L-threonine aldolase [Vicingus serpentipes]